MYRIVVFRPEAGQTISHSQRRGKVLFHPPQRGCMLQSALPERTENNHVNPV
ncbi:MAG: hypothetical protein KKC46_01405 [Proteobacteria bacterium]|nr:hypothetical protein [Pseudomonadota bacterium]